MKTTEQFSPLLMERFYLVHADINRYEWFSGYSEAHDYLMSKWVDRRIATKVITPTNYK
jgi:hypothetical protein